MDQVELGTYAVSPGRLPAYIPQPRVPEEAVKETRAVGDLAILWGLVFLLPEQPAEWVTASETEQWGMWPSGNSGEQMSAEA
jgi:hypothetical protein